MIWICQGQLAGLYLNLGAVDSGGGVGIDFGVELNMIGLVGE